MLLLPVGLSLILEHAHWEHQIEEWQKEILEDQTLPEWFGSDNSFAKCF